MSRHVGGIGMQPEREWVGLRPGRKSVRLEYEEIELEGGDVLRIVHNYGKFASYVLLTIVVSAAFSSMSAVPDR